jgi:hypothetical protein
MMYYEQMRYDNKIHFIYLPLGHIYVIGARLMMVPTLGRLVLATPGRAFIPDAFSDLASSVQRLVFIGFDNVFIGIDYFSMSTLTTSPTSSLCTRFWQDWSMPLSPTCAWFWQN